MTAQWITADVFDGLATLEDGSVDLVVTSPPFLALRSYLPADHPDKHKEIGSEATPAEFIDVLLRVTAELRRVLAPHGSICVELGDTYSGSMTGETGSPYRGEGADGRVRLEPVEIRPTLNLDRSGWPLAKSRTLIPQLYEIALAYGINPLTGAPSPAGQWRIRNVVTWARPNPPVGALGDKWRPATSDLIVACVSPKRYWDDLATRRPFAREYDERDGGSGIGAVDGGSRMDHRLPERRMTQSGAPLLDYWEIPLLEGEEPKQYGPEVKPKAKPRDRQNEAAMKRGGNWDTFPNVESTHEAGAPLLDYWEIPPGGYKGSHYAVFPEELVVPCVKAMCPEKVCRVCGEPSRRITKDTSAFDVQPILAAHIKERREALGITSDEINGWFGFKEIAKNWERTDSHGAAIPNTEVWPVLKERLGLSDEFDPVVLGERKWTEDPAEYVGGETKPRITGDFMGSGSHTKVDGGITRMGKTLGWTDCGHDDYRPGLILDPFAGSGTTLSVATGHGHDAIGIDLDPRNADLARDRIGPFLFEETRML